MVKVVILEAYPKGLYHARKSSGRMIVMAMGKRLTEQQGGFWIVATEMPTIAAHPFYKKLNEVLDNHGFDAFVEVRCREFYAQKMGRPSLPPAVYFRALLIGYFEGIDSERGIAWRLADSVSLKGFCVL